MTWRTQLSRPLTFAILSVAGSVLSQGGATEPIGHIDLLAKLADIEAQSGRLCATRTGEVDLHARIIPLVNELKTSPEGPSSGPSGVLELNRLLFDRLGVRASRDLRDPCNLFPSAILDRKQGYCVGTAALYLALAEQLGLPVFAVATPSHVFLRYDDGTTRINIETQEGGADLPDERYVREQGIPARALKKGVFMRNLTEDRLLAQVHNNLGVVYSEKRDYERAAKEYDLALSLDPRLPAAYYNLGNDLLAQGDPRRAIRLFSKALRLYSTDIWALNNRGLAYKQIEKRRKARRDFERALEIDPAFETARMNLGTLGSD